MLVLNIQVESNNLHSIFTYFYICRHYIRKTEHRVAVTSV